jgi:hypothetical protein
MIGFLRGRRALDEEGRLLGLKGDDAVGGQAAD